MKKVLIVYESRTGNVKEIAEIINKNFAALGANTTILPIENITNDNMEEADAIIVGSFTSYGILAGKTKTFFDKSIVLHGKLQNKVGAAFVSSGDLGGGNETTLFSILQMFLVHGMIIAGDSEAPHFGVVSIGKADEEVKKSCERLAKRIMILLNKF